MVLTVCLFWVYFGFTDKVVGVIQPWANLIPQARDILGTLIFVSGIIHFSIGLSPWLCLCWGFHLRMALELHPDVWLGQKKGSNNLSYYAKQYLFHEVCWKISPWPCWCWGPPWGWGWPQNSGPRVWIKNGRIPRWSAWKTEGVGYVIVHLKAKMAVGERDSSAFLSRFHTLYI